MALLTITSKGRTFLNSPTPIRSSEKPEKQFRVRAAVMLMILRDEGPLSEDEIFDIFSAEPRHEIKSTLRGIAEKQYIEIIDSDKEV